MKTHTLPTTVVVLAILYLLSHGVLKIQMIQTFLKNLDSPIGVSKFSY